MAGMKVLVQAQVPISRPDDFLAEMLKSDEHMGTVKSRLLRQQQRIQTFEEKKQRTENKKFHKAIKDYKMKQKHADKRESLDQINKFKTKLRAGDDDDAAFDKVMKPNKGQTPTFKKNKVIDIVRERFQQKRQNQFKDKFSKAGKK